MTSTTTEAADTGVETRRRSIGLREAFAAFTRWTSPRIIAVLFSLALATRLTLGGWTGTDAIIAGIMIVAQPFVEWIAHITLLHMRPVTIGRFTFDPMFARKHREHHADPREMRLVFLPTPVVVQLAALAVLSTFFAFPRLEQGFTFLTTITAIGLVYEWTHYLVHTDYRPKRWLYRTLWRNHRLHHYKSEKYWFAFTATYPDHLFRTNPDPSTIETSPTVRTIIEDAAA